MEEFLKRPCIGGIVLYGVGMAVPLRFLRLMARGGAFEIKILSFLSYYCKRGDVVVDCLTFFQSWIGSVCMRGFLDFFIVFELSA